MPVTERAAPIAVLVLLETGIDAAEDEEAAGEREGEGGAEGAAT